MVRPCLDAAKFYKPREKSPQKHVFLCSRCGRKAWGWVVGNGTYLFKADISAGHELLNTKWVQSPEVAHGLPFPFTKCAVCYLRRSVREHMEFGIRNPAICDQHWEELLHIVTDHHCLTYGGLWASDARELWCWKKEVKRGYEPRSRILCGSDI